MDAVAISIHYSTYRATVHYESCPYFKTTYHHAKLAIAASMRVVLCKFCKPNASDIASIAGELDWSIPTADAMSKTIARDWDTVVEGYYTTNELNGGRTLQKLRPDERYFQ